MQPRLVPRYDNAAGGVCFLTHNAQKDGERIIDLDITVDDLPAWGHLCVSETAVTLLAEMLGLLSADKVNALIDDHALAVQDAMRWEARARAAEWALEAVAEWRGTVEAKT